MRNSLFALPLGMFLALSGCQKPAETNAPPGTNIVTVFGAIHGQHERSDRYSLDVLRDAIVEFNPDVVMVELPPDRFKAASGNFAKYGEVRESRADDFPELTQIVFPLQKKLGFKMIPVAAWSKQMADERRTALDVIENDPSRSEDWAAYQDDISKYTELVAGKSDDPEFIHSGEYDAAVKARQEPYEKLFGDELGTGGWKQVNEAHLALMRAALDDLGGQEKRILILFGAWHKYKILEELEGIETIKLVNAREYF